jgi:exosortase
MTHKHIRHKHSMQMNRKNRAPSHLVQLAVVGFGLFAVTIWSYWPTIVSLFKDWQGDDDYSAGQLVPLIAVFLLWRERKKLRQCLLKPFWWGAGLIVLAQAARTYGLLFMYESAERYSLVLTIAGLVLMVTGRQVFRTVSWILIFLFLMVPLPGQIHNLISAPLQNTATTGSVILLEAFGPRVSQQGNVVMLNGDTPMAVEEACSGLRMLTAFVIISAFVAYMVKRSRWQKTVILLSSIPVAIICNIVRLFVTAILILLASTEIAEKFFHDFAGLVMMPIAVLLIFGEIWIMDRLVTPEAQPQQAHTKGMPKRASQASAKQTYHKKKQFA